MTQVTTAAEHVHFLELALAEARKCVATPTAFCVGAVIVSTAGDILATGYSRELPGNTHAEANAIDKLPRVNLAGASIYTTMEPCSVRLSGNTPCVDRCLESRFANVYIGVEEPADFVACEGNRRLREAGAAVWLVQREGLREECLNEARRGH